MNRFRVILTSFVAALLTLSTLAIAPTPSTAQDQQDITTIVSALTNPRGFTWGSDGTLFVAEGGVGGATPGEPETAPPVGPVNGGPTARVSWIADGCPVTLAGNLPSYNTSLGEASGAADVAILDGTVYTLITGGGASHGNPETPAGIYTIAGDGSATLVADLGAWVREHPVAMVPEADYDREGSYFDLLAEPGGSDGDTLLVVEANSQQLLRVTLDGDVSRVADLSGDNQVPTVVATAPDGSIYVGYLSGAPYPNGAAKVVEIGDGGNATTVWTGLTTVTGLAVESDGTLLALEMSTGNTDAAPFLVENSGKIVRQTGPDSAEDVVTDLNLPTQLAIGPDDALYVASPAIGANDSSGLILRINPSGDDPVSAADLPAPDSDCPTLVTTPVATPKTEPTPKPTATPEPTATPAASDVASGEVAVSIYDFGFDPPMLKIKVGTTVTWTNTGAVQHTTVHFDKGKKTWDSDIMDPGDVYSFTFEKAGTYDYLCGLHPNMTATIEVVE